MLPPLLSRRAMPCTLSQLSTSEKASAPSMDSVYKGDAERPFMAIFEGDAMSPVVVECFQGRCHVPPHGCLQG